MWKAISIQWVEIKRRRKPFTGKENKYKATHNTNEKEQPQEDIMK
jgi:hypothetical protein